MKILTNIFVSIFFIGYIKLASGTLGSLASILIIFPIISFSQSIIWAAAMLVVSIVQDKVFVLSMLVILATASLWNLRKVK